MTIRRPEFDSDQRGPSLKFLSCKSRRSLWPWNRRRARLNEIQLQRTNGTISTQLLQLREQLRNKESYAAGLEILLRQRNERIDQLQGQLDQLRLKNNQSHEGAQHMAMFG